jgi:predicted lipoprotein with Yx(FWY)xxD motif
VGDDRRDRRRRHAAVVGDQGEQADAPPLYVYDGDVSQADTGAFSPAGVQTPDGQPLFTYSGDVPGAAPQGDNIGGVWHVYQGPTVAQ